jgi:hypothetical protein
VGVLSPTLGVALATALVIMGGGTALAAAPAAAVRGLATPACSDSWTGQGGSDNWDVAANWSTGKVPGPSSNVCITTPGVAANVFAYASIKINSLEIGGLNDLVLAGTTAKPVVATVAASVTLTPGGQSQLSMDNASIHAAEINDQGDSIGGDGTCDLDSPDIILGDGASLGATFGTTTLASLPQLSGGTLGNVTITASEADIVLPRGVTKLASSNIALQANSAIETPSGGNALATLTSVDAQSGLADQNNLTLTGRSFTDDGTVSFDSATLAIDGPFMQAAGMLDLKGAVLDAGRVTIGSGASLYGVGTINASLVNHGSVDASGNGAVGDTLAVNGDYTQTRRASFTSGSETGAGMLAVSGEATLAGAVSTLEGEPDPGYSFPLITFGSLSGRFTKHTLGFKLSTQPGEIDAVIVPQLAPSARTVAPGGTLTVNGASFQFSELVKIYLDHADGTPLAEVVSGYGGEISPTVTIPTGTAAGQHKLIAVDSSGDRATKTITVS